jgi:hypothetical protein
MRCLNPACESVSAIELNISLNMYGGDQYTDYGDPGPLIATSCSGDDDSCETITYVADWLDLVLNAVKPTGDDLVLTHTQTSDIDWDEYLNASPDPIVGGGFDA